MLSRNLKILFPVFVLLSLIVSSCNKDNIETDDPNIIYNATPKTVSIVPSFATFDSLDVNGDGLAEIGIAMTNQGADTGTVLFTSFSQPAGFAIEEITPAPISKSFAKGDSGPVSASVYMTSSYLTFKMSGFRKGLMSGEAYVAFRFTTGALYNYGWMRVGLNSALTEFTIYEYAYNAIPGTGIKIGAK